MTRFLILIAMLSLLSSQTHALDISELEQSIIDLTNAERKKAGLGELKAAEKLFDAARSHAANMAKKEEMAHVLDGRNVTDRVEKTSYKHYRVGENVAYNHPDAAGLLKAWMDSPGHRENILMKEFTEIGIGVVSSEKGEPYFAQVFARPQSAGPTHRASISVTNDTDDIIQVQLPGSEAATSLEAGGIGKFTVVGGSEIPPGSVRVGIKSYELAMKNGAKYVIRSTRRGVEITDLSQSESSPGGVNPDK